MLWIKSFHIIFVITWFAGIFYLPRLFVYHVSATDTISLERFKVMEKRLFWGIMTPSGVLATFFGLILFFSNMPFYAHAGWMHLKLLLVVLLWVFHVYCGVYMKNFKNNKNRHSEVFYRYFNEFPVIILIFIVLLVELQPVFFNR